MKRKIVSFKFTKKQTETKGKPAKTKKNYENIFNDILSGKKIEKKSKNLSQIENQEQKSSNINKKNKIKFISKLDKTNITEELSSLPKNINILTEECEKNNNIIKTNNISDNNENCISITDKNETTKEQNKVNIIDEYIMNKSNENIKSNQNKEIKKQDNKEQNKTVEQKLIPWIDEEENNKKNVLYKKDKQYNYIKSVRAMKNNKKINIKNREINNNIIKSKKNSIEESSNRIYSYKRNISQKNKYNDNTFKQNKNIIKENNIKTNVTKKYNKDKKIFLSKSNNLAFKNKKIRAYNTVDKITITSDIKNDSSYKDYISINNTIKKKKLILNNTNSNINININITNINDKNSKKEGSSPTERKQSKLNTENNYNSNITTVNIINNNNISKKNSNNDYRFMFYSHSTNKHLPYQTKINSKCIKIESIDINLSEENDPPSKKEKFKFKKNLKKNNFDKTRKVISENNDSKEVQSEYEHFRDIDDFWSNKSSTSYSCKSGFTVARKLRSLSIERDKFKMLNNLKNLDKNKMDKIEDKLMNIVNKFHKDNSINNMSKKRRSNIILKYRKNNFHTAY